MIRRAVWSILAAATLIGTVPRAQAETPEETFDTACHAYDQGRWDAAADGFGSLLRFGLADWRLE
jgi:hypothetical protein